MEKLAHRGRETIQIQSSFGTSPAEREACAEPIKEGKKSQWIFFSHQSVEGDWGLIRGRGPSREEEKKNVLAKRKSFFKKASETFTAVTFHTIRNRVIFRINIFRPHVTFYGYMYGSFFFQYKMQDTLYLLNLCLRQQFRGSPFRQHCPNSFPQVYFF